MKNIYEEAGGTYTRQGDYELPNLIISPEKEIEIGVWGQRHRRYLKQYHKIRYYNLLTAGTLNEHLAEVDQQAERMFMSLVAALAEQENVTEKLKAANSMEWEQKTNSIRNRATEIVNSEWIYIKNSGISTSLQRKLSEGYLLSALPEKARRRSQSSWNKRKSLFLPPTFIL